MQQPRMILILVIISSMKYLCLGISGDKGLILGVWNPASFLTFPEFPKDSSSSFNNMTLQLTPTNVQITSLTADPKEAVVFAAIRDTIYIYPNFSIWQNVTSSFPVQFKGKSVAVGQIAYDFVSSNLYWCDSLLDWIAMKPANNFNNTIYKVVIQKDLTQPEGLVLDPVDRLMFFSDNAPNSRIEKASLDGQDRVVILHSSLTRVFSLTVDTGNDKLYWVDHVRQTLEGCDYDGSNRRVIKRMNSVPMTGITYYQNTLHVVSSVSKSMFGVDTTSGSLLYTRTFLSAQPFAILAYDAENPRPPNDPCSNLNCQHICVNARSGPKCLCAEGFRLDSNDNTCKDKSWFFERGFIVSNASVFSMHEVHSSNGQINSNPPLIMSNNIIETFAVDSRSDIIYFVDSLSSSLKKLDIISLQINTLSSISPAKDLTFDWIANILVWIESDQSRIQSYSINSMITETIYSSLPQLISLTVDPHNGIIFWISGTSSRSIFRGSWTREAPKLLISSANLNNPSSLQYDVSSNRLYWLDNTILKSSLTNGTDIKSHMITGGAAEIIVYKDYFGWINGNKMFFSRRSSISAEDELDTIPNSRDVVVFDSLLQQDRRGTCHILNGGCGEICVPEENGRRCECDVGLQLQVDQSCDRDLFSENFIIVTDFSHGRILQIDLQNGTVVKLPITLNKAPGIAFDKSTKTLFYSETSSNTITSATLHGKNKTLFYAIGYADADRLAIDYSTGNLYYTAVGLTASQSYIGVVHRSKSLHKTLISNLHFPRDIALYSSKGNLFWTEFGNQTKIGKASMDGTSIGYIATTDIGWPNGLTIDFTASRLYWTDGHRDRIESSDLNGGNRQVLAADSGAHLMSIVNHGHYLFYTAWNRQRITKMDKRTGTKVVFMSNHPEFGRLDSLDIYADENQDVSSSCSMKNGFCSTFCFPTPSGKTCGCQDNVDLQSDQLTCEGVSKCPTLLPNLNFLDCRPYPGLECEFECKAGYRLAINTSVSCGLTGQWAVPTNSLCEAILCPVSSGSVILPTNCSRRIGDSCSFNCTDGYRPTSSTNLVCTADGTWDRDPNTICLRPGCSESINNGQFINCQYKNGETCRYECNDPFEMNPSFANITCQTNGEWSHDTDGLCVMMCSGTIKHGQLEAQCQRQIGNSCLFTCVDNYKSTIVSTSIICTTGGVWNENIDLLCKLITCPLEVTNGNVSVSCRGMIGEKCDVSCRRGASVNTVDIICLSSGVWDKDTSVICGRQDDGTEEVTETSNMTSMYVGISAAVVVLVVAAIVCWIFYSRRKQTNSARNPYEEPSDRPSEGYETFENRGFDGYSTLDDINMQDDPQREIYLTVINANKQRHDI